MQAQSEGAVLPTLVALLVVLPLKGRPLGVDWQAHVWLTAFLVNSAWGIGTGLILTALPDDDPRARHPPA